MQPSSSSVDADIVTIPFLDLDKGNPHTYHERTLSKIFLPEEVVSAGVKEIDVVREKGKW
jgi:hypothetical protein